MPRYHPFLGVVVLRVAMFQLLLELLACAEVPVLQVLCDSKDQLIGGTLL